MPEKNRLRAVEKAIISRLEIDARVPFSRIGKLIRKSQQQVSYTVNTLVGKGAIQRFYTIMDYSRLNVINFRAYFKVSYVTKEKFDELISYLVSDAHTAWIATCGGRYDLICTFLALNPSQFNKTLRGITAKFPRQLQNYNVLTTIVIRRFGRKYLFKDMLALKELICGGDREPEDIDGTDMEILGELSKDARRSSVKIGNMLSMTPKTVMQRIRRLREMEIIMGFKPSLDIRKMGYISSLLLIKYHNVSTELENDMIHYLKAHPNVVGIVKTLGEWDIEIRIEAPDTMEFRKIEIEIRQKFTLLIQQTESVPLYKTYKTNYFPAFLIKE